MSGSTGPIFTNFFSKNMIRVIGVGLIFFFRSLMATNFGTKSVKLGNPTFARYTGIPKQMAEMQF